jgi:hypothetical protein
MEVRLETGQTLTTSFWIRAPETLGAHSVPVYFYYEAPPASGSSRSHHYRMVKLTFAFKVTPSVTVSAVRFRPRLHDNDLCQTVMVAVNNATAAVHTQPQASPDSSVNIFFLEQKF